MRISSPILVALVVSSSPVFADDPTAPAPAFVTMDRQDATSRIGIEGTAEILNNTPGTSASAGRLDIHGQYVSDSGLGGYLDLPLSFMSASVGPNSDSFTGLGDLELGALYAMKLHLPVNGLGAVFHVGLALPTGSTGGGDVIANLAGDTARITDLVLAYPEGTSLRMAASPTFTSQWVFARVDLGVDVNFASKADGMNNVTHNLFRLNAALGVKYGPVSAAFESTNTYDIPNGGDNSNAPYGSNWINTAALSFRYRARTFEPYFALVFPFDHDAHQILDVAFTFGLELRLHPLIGHGQ